VTLIADRPEPTIEPSGFRGDRFVVVNQTSSYAFRSGRWVRLHPPVRVQRPEPVPREGFKPGILYSLFAAARLYAGQLARREADMQMPMMVGDLFCMEQDDD